MITTFKTPNLEHMWRQGNPWTYRPTWNKRNRCWLYFSYHSIVRDFKEGTFFWKLAVPNWFFAQRNQKLKILYERTNREHRTIFEFSFSKKRVVNTHIDIGIIATHHHNDRQTTDRQPAADVDTSLQKKAESKQIGRRIGSWICQVILECKCSMNL